MHRSILHTCAAVAVAALAAPASAVFVGTEQVGGIVTQLYIDPGDFTGGVLFTPGPDTRTIAGGDLILGNLIGFESNATTQLSVLQGTAVPAEKAGVLEDLSIQTGFLNPTSLTYEFNTPVRNVVGYDVIVFDFGGNDDGLVLTANGVSLNITDGPESTGINAGQQGIAAGSNGFINITIDRYNTGVLDTVAGLEALSLGAPNQTATQGTAFAYLFELSDFGVALGDSINVATFTDSDATADIFLIAGLPGVVPEPASMSLLALGGLGLVRRRR